MCCSHVIAINTNDGLFDSSVMKPRAPKNADYQLLKNQTHKAERLIWSCCCLNHSRNSLTFITPAKSKMDPILIHMNAVHTPLPVFKMHLNIRSMARSFKSSSPCKISLKNFLYRNVYIFWKQHNHSWWDITENMNYDIQDFKLPWNDLLAALISHKLQFLGRVFTRKRKRSCCWFVPFLCRWRRVNWRASLTEITSVWRYSSASTFWSCTSDRKDAWSSPACPLSRNSWVPSRASTPTGRRVP
jgi:hypothetical protein